MTHSRGNGKTIKEYWYDENTEPQEYYPYRNVDLLINLNGTYENYKRKQWTIRFCRYD